uniref:Uncharacterized protein n=1 Tax=Anguilla anguilla TaxID=7936 RepID=A0A0E9X4J0_ANGAN
MYNTPLINKFDISFHIYIFYTLMFYLFFKLNFRHIKEEALSFPQAKNHIIATTQEGPA